MSAKPGALRGPQPHAGTVHMSDRPAAERDSAKRKQQQKPLRLQKRLRELLRRCNAHLEPAIAHCVVAGVLNYHHGPNKPASPAMMMQKATISATHTTLHSCGLIFGSFGCMGRQVLASAKRRMLGAAPALGNSTNALGHCGAAARHMPYWGGMSVLLDGSHLGPGGPHRPHGREIRAGGSGAPWGLKCLFAGAGSRPVPMANRSSFRGLPRRTKSASHG
jgi:hypothetical protein